VWPWHVVGLYNIEVDGFHCYLVGEQGLWVPTTSLPDVLFKTAWFWPDNDNPGECGAWSWAIDWKLSAVAPCDGIIVQMIRVTSRMADCGKHPPTVFPLRRFTAGKYSIDSGQTYWEAWIVKANEINVENTYGSPNDVFSYWIQSGKGRDKTRGTITVVATFAFYPQALPSLFTVGGAKWAVSLPSTTQDPSGVLQQGSTLKTRKITAKWNCCDGQTRMTTFPTRTPDTA
jgi:hypothetical protein